MEARLRWTAESLDHIARHGIDRAEVEAVLKSPVYWRRHAGGIRVIGFFQGRYLTIFTVPSSEVPGAMEIATARPAEQWEKRLFGRRGKGLP